MILKYNTAIFDMDGTLINSMGIWKDLAVRSFIKRGIQPPENLEHTIFSMTFAEAAAYCIEKSGMDKTPEELTEEWNRDALLLYKTEIELKPFAKELLVHLKDLGYTICLTTSNFKEVAEMVLDRFELSPLFDCITATQEVSRSKLHPDVFLLTASKLHVNPEKCLVFEDSYYAVQGAKAAGMSVVGVYDEYARHLEGEIKKSADYYIYSFDELIQNDSFLK